MPICEYVFRTGTKRGNMCGKTYVKAENGFCAEHFYNQHRRSPLCLHATKLHMCKYCKIANLSKDLKDSDTAEERNSKIAIIIQYCETLKLEDVPE